MGKDTATAETRVQYDCTMKVFRSLQDTKEDLPLWSSAYSCSIYMTVRIIIITCGWNSPSAQSCWYMSCFNWISCLANRNYHLNKSMCKPFVSLTSRQYTSQSPSSTTKLTSALKSLLLHEVDQSSPWSTTTLCSLFSDLLHHHRLLATSPG